MKTRRILATGLAAAALPLCLADAASATTLVLIGEGSCSIDTATPGRVGMVLSEGGMGIVPLPNGGQHVEVELQGYGTTEGKMTIALNQVTMSGPPLLATTCLLKVTPRPQIVVTLSEGTSGGQSAPGGLPGNIEKALAELEQPKAVCNCSVESD